MKRAIFLITCVAMALSADPPMADAQQRDKIAVVGFLLPGTPRLYGNFVDWLSEGLREAGYVTSRDVLIEPRFARGDRARVRVHAAELVDRKVNVIVAVGMASVRAAKRQTDTIPIVVATASDLVASGLVASLRRPGGNVTGMTMLVRELGSKRLQLVTQALPSVTRVALLFDPNKTGRAVAAKSTSAAATLGVTLHEARVKTPEDFDPAFVAMDRARAGAVIMLVSRMTSSHRTRLIALAGQWKIPAMCWRPSMVRAGCLMSYGAERADMVRRSAAHVARILRGANPAELPVEQPTKFVLAINLKTAKALGITFPPSILLRADKVIE